MPDLSPRDMPSPRFSTAVVEDLSDAVYTQTGVMGLVRLTSNVRLSATISSDGGTEMGGPKGMGGLLASLGKGSPSARRRSLTQPGERAQNERRSQLGPESLDLLAMYVPDLVLRQFSSGLDGRKPPPTGAFSEPLRGALLFADISGFTGLTQQLQAPPPSARSQPPALHAVLHPVHPSSPAHPSLRRPPISDRRGGPRSATRVAPPPLQPLLRPFRDASRTLPC